MRFWLGFFIALFGGLIGIGLLRDLIKSIFTGINDFHLDIVSVLMLVLGLIITAIDNSKQSKYLKKLEDEQVGRTLKPNQRNNLLEDLKNLPIIKVVLMGIQGDRESIRFANTIKEVLIEAGWEVDGVWEEIIIGGVGSGVIIRENSVKQDSMGNTINGTFNKNNINTRVVEKTGLSSERIEIIIGSRP
ncbi:hypothetical protein [Lacinutrix venerupis]|uniref:Uncharacterized protein n=1 Tax=Lacinutrix venerupis TaxID=1486034 RepID=A0AAC9PX21_9FLAO|nr:hypothetical protein [Lacinutrix venerupis]APY00338.1 hypothetical protein BWR22_08420 [Lacinutrix venerupis]